MYSTLIYSLSKFLKFATFKKNFIVLFTLKIQVFLDVTLRPSGKVYRSLEVFYCLQFQIQAVQGHFRTSRWCDIPEYLE